MGYKKVKRKFKKVSFKISHKEYVFLQKCVQLENTTSNKLIKKYLRQGFEELKPRVKEWENQKQPKNQLKLFDFDVNPKQSSMLADQEFAYPLEDDK
ncbi:MAG: hypothetical protein DRI86_13940 [Bacteroidetes bacterium]|nr:MAG: hypothetical protein DRI86_13940 [Bacteroidota bacterium]